MKGDEIMRPRTDIPNMSLKNAFTTSLAILVFISLMSFQNKVQGGDCTMALQLQDPYVRANYESVVEAGRIHDDSGICGVPNTPSEPAPGVNVSGTIFDPISMECINCHDGTVARAVDFRFEKTESLGVTSLITLVASHPIGVDLTKFSCDNKFNHWKSLPPEIVLMDGKVGCASCHNLLGVNYLYLAVDMEKSNLCFTCHRK